MVPGRSPFPFQKHFHGCWVVRNKPPLQRHESRETQRTVLWYSLWHKNFTTQHLINEFASWNSFFWDGSFRNTVKRWWMTSSHCSIESICCASIPGDSCLNSQIQIHLEVLNRRAITHVCLSKHRKKTKTFGSSALSTQIIQRQHFLLWQQSLFWNLTLLKDCQKCWHFLRLLPEGQKRQTYFVLLTTAIRSGRKSHLSDFRKCLSGSGIRSPTILRRTSNQRRRRQNWLWKIGNIPPCVNMLYKSLSINKTPSLTLMLTEHLKTPNKSRPMSTNFLPISDDLNVSWRLLCEFRKSSFDKQRWSHERFETHWNWKHRSSVVRLFQMVNRKI